MGQIESFRLGESIVCNREYHPEKQLLTSIHTAKGENILQDLSYEYDGFSNLASRTDNKRNLEERFTYDHLNRLTGIWLGNNRTGWMDYDAYGRMAGKTIDNIVVFANAEYDATAKPHAIDYADVDAGSFSEQAVTYTCFDKVKTITQGNNTLEYTYGCEWMPDHVIFYRDGIITHEFYDEEHTPKYPKYIKTGYAIDDNAVKKINDSLYFPEWFGQDTITINYIKVYQLDTDCETDEYVQNAQQLNQINSMKRSITISNPNGMTLPSTTNKTLRASDYILINEPFEAASGAQLTLMVHDCPECIDNNKHIDDD